MNEKRSSSYLIMTCLHRDNVSADWSRCLAVFTFCYCGEWRPLVLSWQTWVIIWSLRSEGPRHVGVFFLQKFSPSQGTRTDQLHNASTVLYHLSHGQAKGLGLRRRGFLVSFSSEQLHWLMKHSCVCVCLCVNEFVFVSVCVCVCE